MSCNRPPREFCKFCWDLFKGSKMTIFNYDLFKVIKITILNYNLFKVSKMTIFNYDLFKVSDSSKARFVIFRCQKICKKGHIEMTKKIYLETKSVLGRSILYYCVLGKTFSNQHFGLILINSLTNMLAQFVPVCKFMNTRFYHWLLVR